MSQEYFASKVNIAKAFAETNPKPLPGETEAITLPYKQRYEDYKPMSFDEFMEKQYKTSDIERYQGEEHVKCQCINKYGEHCLNADSSTECDVYTCNIGGRCGNRWALSSWAL